MNTIEELSELAAALSKGSQATIQLESSGDEIEFISKNIISPVPATELQTFVDATLEYHSQFTSLSLGFAVPAMAAAQLIPADATNSIPYINTREQFICGHDIDDILRSTQLEAALKLQLWAGYISALLSLYTGENRATIAVDAKPANFMFAAGQFYYIDFFPPLLRDEAGLITPFHTEIFKRDIYLMSFNFGDMRGILTKVLALTRIDYPDLSEVLIQQALSVLENRLSVADQLFVYVNEQVQTGFQDMNIFYASDEAAARSRLLELLRL
jgi:hypothetical protein